MKKLKTCLVFILLFLIPIILTAEDYYVDASNGNDANNGLSPSSAWRSIGKVNNSWSFIRPGDRILLKRGERFTDSALNIRKGGTLSNPIIIGAFGSGTKPIIDGNSGNMSNGINCSTSGLGNITVQDIMIKNIVRSNSTAVLFTKGLSNIKLFRLEIENSSSNGIYLNQIDTYHIEDCKISDCGLSGIVIYGSPTDPITNGTILGNIIHDIYSGDGITLHRNDAGDNMGPNHLVQGNTVYRCGEEGLDITAGNKITVRRNTTFNNDDSIVVGHGARNVWIDRHYAHDEENLGIIIGPSENVKVTSSVIYNVGADSIRVADCSNFQAYHNTIVCGSSTSGNIVEIRSGASNVTFKNNIFMRMAGSRINYYVSFLDRVSPQSTNSHFDNNTWWNPSGNSSGMFYDHVRGSYSFSRWRSECNQDPNGYFIDPQLVNPSQKNFHLQGYSICVNTGANVGVNRDFEGARIPQGSAPDIGALEYGMDSSLRADAEASPISGTIPLTVNFTGSAAGGKSPYSYNWTFGDGSSSSSQNPTHTFQQAGNYTVTLTITDSESNRDSDSLTVRANVVNPLSAGVVASPTSGEAPLAVSFTGTASGGNTPYSYRWDFGDGDFSTQRNPSHTYSEPGNYTATFTVADSTDQQKSSSVSISVSTVPSAQVQLKLSIATGQPASGQGGSIAPAPGDYTYPLGSDVRLEATPKANYRFARWIGNVWANKAGKATISVSMSQSRTISALFCSLCGDVNGDLRISPLDSQAAFDIFLGKNDNPSICQRENGDVNGDGTRADPYISPADAQHIFVRYLNKGNLPCDCSYDVRTLSDQTQQSMETILQYVPAQDFHFELGKLLGISEFGFLLETKETNLQYKPTQDIHLGLGELIRISETEVQLPIMVNNPHDIDALGFDLVFPPENFEFVGVAKTDMVKDFYQVDGNVTEEGVLRVGAYGVEPIASESAGELVILIFKLKRKGINNDMNSQMYILNTFDDVESAYYNQPHNYREEKKEAKYVRR
ncbi:MAG: PKD domain-containing protein [Candidatus Aminicenantes bacterium]|nr:MAG: PKD domain-containing protein [Candidatus Aminicenantes bacterium]